MEFQEALMKLSISKPGSEMIKQSPRLSSSDASSKARRKWKISFAKSKPEAKPTPPSAAAETAASPPPEFVCFISGSLMADPVIVSSGHTFERACVESCKAVRFAPTLPDSTRPDFATVIPNLAIRAAILSWCQRHSEPPPKPLDLESAGELVRKLMSTQRALDSESDLIRGVGEKPPANFKHAATAVPRRRPSHFNSSSGESSGDLTSPLQLVTRPSCCSSTSNSSEIESEIANPNPNCPEEEEEEEIAAKLRSPLVSVIEDGVVLLRKVTRSREDCRAHLCNARVLSTLRYLIVSRYSKIQVNSVAALVNLSLEKVNKVKIVRSGLVLPLVDVLKGGFPEAQDHACGALFSLALDDENKTAIGVLGALEPLIRMLRSDSKRARHDSALALYHLSLAQSNRSKLVKSGSVTELLNMVKSGQNHMAGRVLLILCNLASCVEGRTAMLDSGAVECLVGALRAGGSGSELENCVAALGGLSQAGLRFKGLAKAAGLVEELRKVEEIGSERAKEKAAKMAETMRGREVEEEEEVDWEELLDSGLGARNRVGGGLEWFAMNSSRF